MKRHQKPTSTTLLLAMLLAAFGIASAVESSEANDTNAVKPFVVAGTEFFDPNQATKFSKGTLEAIRKAVYPRPLVVVHSNVEELNDAVRKSAVNLVIAGPAVYRGNIQSGIRDVATTINNLQPDPDKAIGSLILARKDDESINRIEDLRGKKIGTNVEHGFQGDLVIRKELFDRGLSQDDFFGSVRYYGLDPSKRLEALKDGEVDAVIVNSCYLEREALKGNNILEGLKTVGEKEQTDSFCKSSTKLYPNYSVLIPPGTPNQTIVKIVDALFSMQKGDDGSGWTIAGDFGSTDKLYKDLAFGPYAYLKSWTLNRLWNEYRSWVLFFCLHFVFSCSIR